MHVAQNSKGTNGYSAKNKSPLHPVPRMPVFDFCLAPGRLPSQLLGSCLASSCGTERKTLLSEPWLPPQQDDGKNICHMRLLGPNENV